MNPYIVDIKIIGKWGYCKQFNKSLVASGLQFRGLFETDLASKLINFGGNMVSNFQVLKHVL
jgi:hypothetical protein